MLIGQPFGHFLGYSMSLDLSFNLETEMFVNTFPPNYPSMLHNVCPLIYRWKCLLILFSHTTSPCPISFVSMSLGLSFNLETEMFVNTFPPNYPSMLHNVCPLIYRWKCLLILFSHTTSPCPISFVSMSLGLSFNLETEMFVNTFPPNYPSMLHNVCPLIYRWKCLLILFSHTTSPCPISFVL